MFKWCTSICVLSCFGFPIIITKNKDPATCKQVNVKDSKTFYCIVLESVVDKNVRNV